MSTNSTAEIYLVDAYSIYTLHINGFGSYSYFNLNYIQDK